MALQRMEHVGIVVDDLADATEFFLELGFVRQGEGSAEGAWVDGVVGLDGVQVDFAMVETPDGNGKLELIKFQAPPGEDGDADAPANRQGIRHIAFIVEDLDKSTATAADTLTWLTLTWLTK